MHNVIFFPVTNVFSDFMRECALTGYGLEYLDLRQKKQQEDEEKYLMMSFTSCIFLQG
jgi:hypothetical protein